MFTGITIRNDITAQLKTYGEPIRIQIFTRTNTSGTSVYDDDVTFSKSGNDLWSWGMIFPVGTAQKGSAEAMLLEQGKIQADDMLVYLPGDMNVSGAAVKIGFGSPVDEVRSVIYPGADYLNSVTYDTSFIKVYTRILLTGSFIGEQ